jgi:hypothetical protein
MEFLGLVRLVCHRVFLLYRQRYAPEYRHRRSGAQVKNTSSLRRPDRAPAMAIRRK